MLWITDPWLACQLAWSTLLILVCQLGPWLVWPVVTIMLHHRREAPRD